MRLLLLIAILTAACCPQVDTQGLGGFGGFDNLGGSGAASTTCGVPPPGIDTFCLDSENAGQACCRPGGGVCQGHECAECGPQIVTIEASALCLEPTCCEVNRAALDLKCLANTPGLPVAVVCAANIDQSGENGARHCAKGEPIGCAFGGEATVLRSWCCEP